MQVGSMANMLMNNKAKGGLQKPSLEVHASMHIPMKGEATMKESEKKWAEEDHARLTKEIDAIKDALDNWIPEDVAKKAELSLKSDLKIKQAKLEECKARMAADDEESEGDEGDDEE